MSGDGLQLEVRLDEDAQTYRYRGTENIPQE